MTQEQQKAVQKELNVIFSSLAWSMDLFYRAFQPEWYTDNDEEDEE